MTGWDALLDLDDREGSLHQRLTDAIRVAVVSGRVGPGCALPASRTLASDLGCSRWVVTEAYAQLVAEGLLEARSGSATTVRCPGVVGATAKNAQCTPAFDLSPGVPDHRTFPAGRWARHVREAAEALTAGEIGFPDPRGHHRLRQQLTDYLVRARGAVLTVDDLVICMGTPDAVRRLGQVLRAEGHTHVGVEDPGWPELSAAVRAAELVPVPVPVDDDGLRVDVLHRMPHVRSVIVTPAHQFPTGVALAATRRAALVRWARDVDGLIVESDFDGEFRYDRRRIGVLQALDPTRVALIGAIHKVLSPALLMGWLVAPARWLRPGHAPSVFDQEALARFIGAGSYDRCLRQSRLLHRRRRDRLRSEIAAALPGHRMTAIDAGLHLVLHLNDRAAAAVVAAAARRDLRLVDLDEYRSAQGPPALVLGYGNLADSAVRGAARAVADAVQQS
ncbi:PLP-dependent aminotransferase family protein [Lentzea sp. NPDC051213]|uniref:PLP-dependent aminotransferase family protein n=1 Tax=Lentzea sp. NPDC051213 TaxID=3364126 RepID=UPI0037AC2549